MEYKEEHGDCLVPVCHEPNRPLGRWVSKQRQQRRLLQQGMKSAMTKDRIAMLDAIGFEWDASHLSSNQPKSDLWERRCEQLVEHKEEHGDCNVPKTYEPNRPLGTWVGTQRQRRRRLQQGKKSNMTEDRTAKLEAIGFEWTVRVSRSSAGK